eukprot:TRINITY_DN25641_c0_g1_i1.p1 TRINITY_DN25641_c0_g1~~TRINITY_DN25641_c0_g1_i1.p1  ORF type:complete len:652 (+),score=123.97 TRINITY_DN25641_c0_g1_i1:2044-3999(+)
MPDFSPAADDSPPTSAAKRQRLTESPQTDAAAAMLADDVAMNVTTKPADGQEEGLYCTEERQASQVSASTYRSFYGAVGWCAVGAIMVVVAGIMAAQMLCDGWFALWASSTEPDKAGPGAYERQMLPDTVEMQQLDYLKMYGQLMLVFSCFNFAGFWLEVWGGVRASRRLFTKAWWGLLARPIRFWDSMPPGRLLNRFTQDVNVMDGTLSWYIGIITGAILFTLGHVVTIAFVSPGILLVLPLTMYALEFVAAKYYRTQNRELQRLVLALASPFYDSARDAQRHIGTLGAYGVEGWLHHGITERLQMLQNAATFKAALQVWVGLRFNLVGQLLSVAAMLLPFFIYLGIAPAMMTGMVAFTVKQTQDLSGIVQQLIMNFSSNEQQLISIERLDELSSHGDCLGALSVKGDAAQLTSSEVHLENATFRYRTGVPVLVNLNLYVAAGERLAIVGASGAGKSTLLHIIAGLLPLSSGRLTIGSRAIPHGTECLIPGLGVVSQLPVLFRGSLRSNLVRMDTSLKSGAAVGSVSSRGDTCRLLDSLSRVSLLRPLGLSVELSARDSDMILDDEGFSACQKLSDAQKQLLCVARCLVSSPRVALLDEITAFLAPSAAAEMMAVLKDAFQDTVILVTHQPEALKHFPCNIRRMRAGCLE